MDPTHEVKHASRALAWIPAQGGLYARAQPEAGPLLGSPILRLIRGTYQAQPAIARKLLRERIQTNLPELNEFERAAIRVAAKRVACGAEPTALAQELRPDPPACEALQLPPDLAPPALVAWLAAQSLEAHAHLPRHARPRAVGALALDPSGTLLGVARNSNAIDRTQHAELNLLQGLGPLPAGAHVWVSLEPCKMCAAALAASCPEGLQVTFLEHDPGPMARATALSGIARLFDPPARLPRL